MSALAGEAYQSTMLQRIGIKIIRSGPIPRHVAFIMDGNRRYAKERGLESVIAGHADGFDNLTRVLGFCWEIGISEVTLYAFSLENFKRNREEVDGLMTLAADKFRLMWKEKEKLKDHRIKVRVIGDVEKLTTEIQEIAAKLVLYTKNHDKFFVNFAIPYTSRAEMTDGINQLVEAGIPEKLVSEKAFELSWWSYDCPPPEMLVRTATEDQARLSDFLLWQTGYSVLYFTYRKWPEFDVWDMLKAVFTYQRHHNTIMKAREKHEEDLMRGLSEEQVEEMKKYIEKIQEARMNRLEEKLMKTKLEDNHFGSIGIRQEIIDRGI